jgi:hypothetical protein
MFRRLWLAAFILALGSSEILAQRRSAEACFTSVGDCLEKMSSSLGDDVKADPHAAKVCERKVRQCGERFANRIASASSKAAAATTDGPVVVQEPHLQQRFFLRADPLDNPFPGLTQSATVGLSAGQALGASVNFTANDFVQSKSGSAVTVSSSRGVSVTGMATYLLSESTFIGDYVRWVPAIWASANGNWDNPTKTFGDTSALKVGPMAEFMLYPKSAGGFLNYFEISPYYQTDFYGIAQAQGATIAWTPANPNFSLGGLNPFYKPSFINGFLVLRAEFTDLNVTNPGMTNLIAHNYEWYGAAARAYVFLFPSGGLVNWPAFIADRLSFVATVQSFWDASSDASATMYSAALQYKFACSAKAGNDGSGDSNPCQFGAPSFTVQYDNGTDRDTLQRKKLLSAKITYAF